MKWFNFNLTLLACLLIPVFSVHAEQVEFKQLLAESQMVYQQPEGFVEASGALNALWQYEYVIQNPQQQIEVRYSIRPLSRMQIDYNDPHSATPEPEHMFPLMFSRLSSLLSTGSDTPSQEYRHDDAKKHFNADWAAATAFDVNPIFSADYSNGFLLALHKNKVADAYVIFLFNDSETAKPLINKALQTLTFEAN